MDTKLQWILDRLGANERLKGTVDGLAKTVSGLQERLKEQQATDKKQEERVWNSAAGLQQAAASMQRAASDQQAAIQELKHGKTFADMVGGRSGGRSLAQGRVNSLQEEAYGQDRSATRRSRSRPTGWFKGRGE